MPSSQFPACLRVGAEHRELVLIDSPLQCVDITFVANDDPRLAEVNETNCYNSTDIGFANLYTITIKESGSDNYTSTSGAMSSALRLFGGQGWLSMAGWLPVVLGGMWVLL
jgi:hypothetical protein